MEKIKVARPCQEHNIVITFLTLWLRQICTQGNKFRRYTQEVESIHYEKTSSIKKHTKELGTLGIGNSVHLIEPLHGHHITIYGLLKKTDQESERDKEILTKRMKGSKRI